MTKMFFLHGVLWQWRLPTWAEFSQVYNKPSLLSNISVQMFWLDHGQFLNNVKWEFNSMEGI